MAENTCVTVDIPPPKSSVFFPYSWNWFIGPPPCSPWTFYIPCKTMKKTQVFPNHPLCRLAYDIPCPSLRPHRPEYHQTNGPGSASGAQRLGDERHRSCPAAAVRRYMMEGLGPWMSRRWKLGSKVGRSVGCNFTLIHTIYRLVITFITHLLTIDTNFLDHPSGGVAVALLGGWAPRTWESWLITIMVVFCFPSGVIPLQMAFSWLINGGDVITTY